MFRNFVKNYRVLDLGFVGHPYTWWNKREGDDVIKSRLDRVLYDPRWSLMFNSATCFHMGMIGADHCPIMPNTEVETIKSKRRFLFDRRWAGKDGYEEVIKNAWAKEVSGCRWYQVCEEIKNVRMGFIKWCKRNNFNSRIRIDDIQLRLKEAFEFGGTSKEEVRQLEQDLDHAWGEEEVFLEEQC
ncbi:hypothetical protein LIER_31190 [Lithospermum erythrorhizon]|uniref:Uncharacterized protein n=1 Tax=Lithospermum erythrorhizon TaxID=34254 RepID=A0AAV3RTS8_LITER